MRVIFKYIVATVLSKEPVGTGIEIHDGFRVSERCLLSAESAEAGITFDPPAKFSIAKNGGIFVCSVISKRDLWSCQLRAQPR